MRLSPDHIRTEIADSEAIYSRGVQLCAHGAFVPMRIDAQAGHYAFIVDGNYGDYDTRVDLSGDRPVTSCDCPYPGEGCKHIVAILLYVHQLRDREEKARRSKQKAEETAADDLYLTPEEIRKQALKDRESRARREAFSLSPGEIFRRLSEAGIGFVELSGKVPVHKRQTLIDTFTSDPQCRVFLSTDAGGTGLNLQAADCVVNFELPWNPARLNQRIGRVNRIGQQSRCINVVNLVSRGGIEERIMAGLQLKLDLFKSVFEEGADTVTFSQAKREALLNQLRELVEEPFSSSSPQDEIPEDTPHYMNPAALGAAVEENSDADAKTAPAGEGVPDSEGLDITGEEEDGAPQQRPPQGTPQAGSVARPEAPPPEKIEAVLNQGVGFLSGLVEMATGQPLAGDAPDGRLVTLDRDTGEVTLKFKLPSFS